MLNKTTTTKFNVGDIVTIASDYKEFAKLEIAQPQIQVYYVMSVNTDGTITLAGVFPNIPAKHIEGVSIESVLAKQIYYVPELQARHYVPGKVKQQEDIYSRQPFTKTMEEKYKGTQLWQDLLGKNLCFVHELQHWFEKRYGYSKICINQFWGMRKPLQLL